jgi:hypothetical protein
MVGVEAVAVAVAVGGPLHLAVRSRTVRGQANTPGAASRRRQSHSHLRRMRRMQRVALPPSLLPRLRILALRTCHQPQQEQRCARQLFGLLLRSAGPRQVGRP